jgi:hypothetical protein
MSKKIIAGFFLLLGVFVPDTSQALDYIPYHHNIKHYPKPIVTVYPVIGTINNPIKFDAGLSQNYRDETGSFRYRFKIEGEDWSPYQGPVFYYTPQDYGKFTIRVEAYDTQEKTSAFTETCFWVKTQEGGKNARVQIIKKPRYAGEKSEFLVKIFSAPNEGKWARVRWDFDGDGDFDTGWSENLRAHHIYKNPQVVRPKVEVQLREKVYKTLSLGEFVIRRNFALDQPKSVLQHRLDQMYSGNHSLLDPIQGDSIEGAAKIIRDKSGCRSAHCLRDKNLTAPISSSRNLSLQPKITVSKKEGTLQTLFIFDASNTQGKNPQFFWNIFDGENNLFAEGKQVKKRFDTKGEKTITVTIIDGNQQKKINFPVWVK